MDKGNTKAEKYRYLTERKKILQSELVTISPESGLKYTFTIGDGGELVVSSETPGLWWTVEEGDIPRLVDFLTENWIAREETVVRRTRESTSDPVWEKAREASERHKMALYERKRK